MFKPENIIIIGGNAAGPAAAAKAKRVSPSSRVIMFEEGDFISTGTCEMPYVIAGEIEDHRKIVFFNSETFYKSRGVEVFSGCRAEEIDRKSKTVLIRNVKENRTETFRYDSLIIATGSTSGKLPSLPNELVNVFYIKQIKDLVKYENYIRENPVTSALIVGAGYIGLELADALSSRGISVTMTEKEELPMPGADLEVRALILETLKANSISFYGNSGEIKSNIKDGNRVSSVMTAGRRFEPDIIFVSAGFIPNTQLAVSCGLKTGKSGAIITDNRLRTSDPYIYAAGDNSEIVNFVTGKPDYFPSAVIARNFGHIAGENAAGGNAFAFPVVKNLSVKIFDNFLVQVGLGEEEAKYHRFNYASVFAFGENIIKVMPSSRKIYGKVIFDINSSSILGAAFFGSREVSGYADLISAMIRTKSDAGLLSGMDFNYTPPLSPFMNILSVLGRKIKGFRQEQRS